VAGKSDDSGLGPRAFAFALDAARFTTMDRLAEAVTRAIAPLGMTAAASGVVAGPKAATGNPFHFTNWPDFWVDLYRDEDFLLADPIPRWARNSGQALTWTTLINLLPRRDRGRRVIEIAAKHGYLEGVLVPMRTRDNSPGLISLGGGRKSLSLAEKTYLVMIGRVAFEHADRIENRNAAGQAAPILTLREIECLTLLVGGHGDAEIGKLLGMTVRTVRFHLGNARKKFRATSRTQLAALATANGYVVP
jgi:DNA-binding CsgD family transcriptional regulator